jgi:2-polyprenyl-3-methyl-5-hydroxy-6-metoxy-1,4-benzoquinol methylase
MNITSSNSDYLHSAEIPCSGAFLYSPIKQFLSTVKNESILDIGCGNGQLCKFLNDNKMGEGKIIGIDPSESGITNARIILPQSKFYCMGIYDDPAKIEENNFDIVISTEVIEHFFYPRELLRFAKTKLTQGGYLLLTTPYHGYLKNLILSILGKWDSHHTVFWDGGHIKFWSRKTLSRLLKEEGFEVEKFVGCGRVPYVWKSMLLISKLK